MNSSITGLLGSRRTLRASLLLAHLRRLVRGSRKIVATTISDGRECGWGADRSRCFGCGSYPPAKARTGLASFGAVDYRGPHHP